MDIASDLINSGVEALKVIRDNISNVCEGKVTENHEYIKFTYRGEEYEIPMYPVYSVPGISEENDKRIAFTSLLKYVKEITL